MRADAASAARFPTVLLRGIGIEDSTIARIASSHGLAPVRGGDSGAAGEPDTALVVLLRDGSDPTIQEALRPPAVACLELGERIEPVARGEDLLAACLLASLDPFGLQLLVSARTAYTTDAGRLFSRAVAERLALPGERNEALELAVHEAAANAVVHGCLETDGFARENLEAFDEYCERIESALAVPRFGRRFLWLRAHWTGERLTVSITDQGKGDPLTPALASAGDLSPIRGLGLIRSVADGVEIGEGGRSLTMVFRR